ncbi:MULTISPECIES: response regulator transcription factor [unclassified Microbulbifer]|uniref:response regulator transcription factor n=1 Tax=unclassified Microbulbifer TaxID=2619833 RepID=UPI0027E595FC|nr:MULTISPECIES: response regulator transcription factor [unclassified Microbulbifer]
MSSSGAHILVVEDDIALADWICDYLQMHNFSTTMVHSGDIAVDAIRTQRPELVLLDIMLPHKNGFEICKDVRTFCRCPILMMTACAEEADELLSLELGADDYINKPVRPKVLLARIKALMRRSNHESGKSELTFGALTIKKQTKTLVFRGEPLPISSNEFDVLWLLASRAGQVIPRAELVSQLRGIDYDGFDRSIDIRISRLRKKLADDSEQPIQIKTIWGKGYVFMCEAR